MGKTDAAARMSSDVEAIPPGRMTLADLAYERLEEMIVTCTLRPGMFLSIQALQDRTGLGRTPIHQAVNRLAADTLIVIRPRHGLQLAPIDLPRERTLLTLRRDMERFVVRLATERATDEQRDRLRGIIRGLRDGAGRMGIAEFNRLDRRMDQWLLDAANEPFLAHTLRPLHTIFRRIGWVYHSWVNPQEGLAGSLDRHLAILDAVAGGRVSDAVTASDGLIAFMDSLFGPLGRGVDPALLDCNQVLLATA